MNVDTSPFSAPWNGIAEVRALPHRRSVLVTLVGELDIMTCEPLAALAAALPDDQLVVVDTSSVTFVDCAGWSAVRGLERGGAGFVLHDASPPVLRLLSALKLSDGLASASSPVAN